MDMSGKVVLITGASRGIGAAAARGFAAAGARVALVARNAQAIDALKDEIGAQALALSCDVAQYPQVRQAVDATVARFGGLDVLINNAGVIEPIGHLCDLDVAAYGRTIDINLKGVMHGMRAAMPVMLAAGHGTIINVSSGAAHHPVEGWAAYCSAKAGALMLTRMGDKEARDKGLRVLGLSPGTVATDMQREIKASGINPVSQLDWTDHIPPEWAAAALVWMCGPGADPYLGGDVSLREDSIRRAVGLA